MVTASIVQPNPRPAGVGSRPGLSAYLTPGRKWPAGGEMNSTSWRR